MSGGLVTRIGNVELSASDSIVAIEAAKLWEREGEVSPEGILTVAAAPEHPLHDRFEWDDSLAAVEYRRTQALALIRSVRVTVLAPDRPPVEIRALVSKRDLGDESKPYSYVPIEAIAGSTAHQLSLRERLHRDVRTMQKRYSSMSGFFDALDEVIAEVRQERLEIE